MEATELCPWCNSVISRDKFLEIETRIRKEEKTKLDAKAASMRQVLERQFAAQYEKQRLAAEKKLQAESDKEIAKLAAERDAATKKLKDAEAREFEIRKQAKDDAERVAVKELQKQREALEKAGDTAVLKLQAERNREREVLQKKVKVLERELLKKTANQLTYCERLRPTCRL